MRPAEAPGAHIEDYNEACPDGWAEDDDHFCVSPDTYVGPCVGRKRLGSIRPGAFGILTWLSPLVGSRVTMSLREQPGACEPLAEMLYKLGIMYAYT